MAFINQAHEMVVNSELDIFSGLPMQTGIESGSLHSYRPVTSISNNGPIEFVVSGGSVDEYMDLARVYIHVKARITVPAPVLVQGAVAPPAVPVIGPVNNWLHSMFSQVDVFLNQKCITPPGNCYPYRAYLETLLNYSLESKTSHLSTALYADDSAGHMNSTTADNKGFTTRRSFTSDNKICDLYGPLHCDLFNVNRYLLGGVEMSIKLQRAKDTFHLMGVANSGATFEIIDAELYVRKVKINPSVVMAHNIALGITTAKYPINRVDVKAITIPSGSQTKTMDNVYIGALPKRCIIGFVSTRAFNGSVTENPYNFMPYGYTNLSIYMDSILVPSKPFVCDFDNHQFIRAYNSLFEGCNINHADIGNNISRSSYPHGYALVAVDLTPDLSASSSHISQSKTGSLRIEVHFNAPLADSVTAVIFSEFSGNIEVDKYRSVMTDFSS